MGRQILTLLGFIISKDLDKFLNTITLKYWRLSIDKYYLKLSFNTSADISNSKKTNTDLDYFEYASVSPIEELNILFKAIEDYCNKKGIQRENFGECIIQDDDTADKNLCIIRYDKSNIGDRTYYINILNTNGRNECDIKYKYIFDKSSNKLISINTTE